MAYGLLTEFVDCLAKVFWVYLTSDSLARLSLWILKSQDMDLGSMSIFMMHFCDYVKEGLGYQKGELFYSTSLLFYRIIGGQENGAKKKYIFPRPLASVWARVLHGSCLLRFIKKGLLWCSPLQSKIIDKDSCFHGFFHEMTFYFVKCLLAINKIVDIKGRYDKYLWLTSFYFLNIFLTLPDTRICIWKYLFLIINWLAHDWIMKEAKSGHPKTR